MSPGEGDAGTARQSGCELVGIGLRLAGLGLTAFIAILRSESGMWLRCLRWGWGVVGDCVVFIVRGRHLVTRLAIGRGHDNVATIEPGVAQESGVGPENHEFAVR
jgi:hypothetical protein